MENKQLSIEEKLADAHAEIKVLKSKIRALVENHNNAIKYKDSVIESAELIAKKQSSITQKYFTYFVKLADKKHADQDVIKALRRVGAAIKNKNFPLADRIAGSSGNIFAIGGCHVCGINLMEDGKPSDESMPCGVRLAVESKDYKIAETRGAATCPFE